MSDLTRGRSNTVVIIAWLWISLATLSLAFDSARLNPVKRVSGNRDADLIDALIVTGRLDQAAAICDLELAAGDAASDRNAKWVVRRSQVETRRQMMSDDFDDTRIDGARASLDELLRRYPQHPRLLFLRTASLHVLDAAARHDVITAVVMPSQSDRSQRAIGRFTKLASEIEQLMKQIRTEISLHGDRPSSPNDGGDHKSYAANLNRLQQELRVDLVSIALVQSELFAPRSRDRLAAATVAEQAADKAIEQLPIDSQARSEVERLRVQAILRGGDQQRAGRELVPLRRTYGLTLPPQVRALEVQVAIAAGDLDAAKKLLDAFYGQSPIQSPPSIEMDLAKLDYLMLAGGEPVGHWLEFIEQRGGAYARRRAEAISLARLRSSNSSLRSESARTNTSSRAVDPSLVAAQGQDWLRRDEPERAAELLAAAAAAEIDPDRALQYAKQSAAAWTAAGQASQAANILATISLAKPKAKQAAAAHLQAALVAVTESKPETAPRVEALLRQTTNRWPTSESATLARRWLVKLLTQQDRLVEAAEAATPIASESEIDAAQFKLALESWKAAVHTADAESISEIGQRMKNALAPFLAQEAFASTYRTAAAFLLERELLSDLPPQAGEAKTPEAQFGDALISFRQTNEISSTLHRSPEHKIDDAVWRLMIDGRRFPESRAVIAELINGWSVTSSESLGHAERLIWLGNVDQAVSLIRRRIRGSNNPGTELKAAAELLAASDRADAKAAAIKLWDELAAGIPRDSQPWHAAKLNAIVLLSQIGRIEEASRRAKYVLLTSPPGDDDLALQYRRYEQTSKD